MGVYLQKQTWQSSLCPPPSVRWNFDTMYHRYVYLALAFVEHFQCRKYISGRRGLKVYESPVTIRVHVPTPRLIHAYNKNLQIDVIKCCTHADELAPVYSSCCIIRGYVSRTWGCRSQRCYVVDIRHLVALELGCQAYSCLFLLILLQNIKLQKWHLNGSIRLYHICLFVLIDSGSRIRTYK